SVRFVYDTESKLWHSVHKHTHDKQLAAFRNQTLIDDNLRLLWKLHYHPNLDLMQALNEPDFSIKTALSLKKNQHFGIFQSGVDKILKSLTPQNFLELQLLLTHIFQEQRMDKLSLQETSDTIYMVMKKSAEKFRLDPKGLVIFKTMLKKLEQRGILSEGQRRELKVVAEQSSMSNSPYFRSLEATVEQHTRRLDAIESNVATLASHLQAVSYSVNSLRQGLEEARKVNKRIGMVQSILSVIPFASVIAETAGTYTKEALESMIDFGDALGALELVQVSGTELKELAEIKPEQIENFVNSKLESIEEKYRLNAHQDMQHLATDIPLIAAASQSPAFTKANAAEGKDMLKKHLLGTAFLPAYAKAMDGEANYQRAISYLQQNPAGNKNHSDYYNGTYQEAVSQNVVTQEITNQNITSTEVKSQNVVTQEIVKQTNPAPKRTYQYRPLTFNEKAIITAWLFLVGALVSHMMY
ncbi:MAG: hypothetical protein OXT67_11715, partial [Zetaproteobacteria bacterium]|nr:hypothetical protein [Zetaproteobacteria bacterium]